MEDLAWNPIYMNTRNWRETIWCNPFLPPSNSLLQCSLRMFSVLKSSFMFMLQSLLVYCKKCFPLYFSCIETTALKLLHVSESLCFGHHQIVTAYTSYYHIIISVLAPLRLKQHMASPHWGHWMGSHVLTSDSGHRRSQWETRLLT